MKIGGEGLERAYRFGIPFRRYGNMVSFSPAVDASGIAVDPLEQRGMHAFLLTLLLCHCLLLLDRRP